MVVTLMHFCSQLCLQKDAPFTACRLDLMHENDLSRRFQVV